MPSELCAGTSLEAFKLVSKQVVGEDAGLVCFIYQNCTRYIKGINCKALFKMTLLKDALGIARIPSILLGHLFSIVVEVLPA